MCHSPHSMSDGTATEQVDWTTGDVAQFYGVTRKTVRAWADAGKIPGRRTLGGHWRFVSREILLHQLETERAS
jgi:excisionase family DNA binding protein